MKTDRNKILKLLGRRPTGDLGPYTIYTTRRGAMVIFPRSPPQKPPSTKQISQRQSFSAAADGWANLTAQLKLNWTTAAKRAHLNITGHNLYFWYVLIGDNATIKTVERQSGITLISW